MKAMRIDFLSHAAGKFLLPAVCLIWMITPAQAQPRDELDEGLPVVRAFARQMSSLKSFKASLECEVKGPGVKMGAPIRGQIEAKGTAFFLKADGLELYSDGETRWQYLPEENEVTIASLDDVGQTPLDRPLLIFQQYEKLFKVRYRGEHTKNGVRYLDFTFYPRDLRQPYSQIHIAVEAKSYTPYKMTYQGKDGSVYLVTIKNFQRDVPVRSDYTFDQSMHPGVEIVDLR